MFYSPLLLSSEQQSVHAKEATKDMEVAILKTCQSVSDLRREVSSSLSLTVKRCSRLQNRTWLKCLWFAGGASVAAFLAFIFPAPQPTRCCCCLSVSSLCHLCSSSFFLSPFLFEWSFSFVPFLKTLLFNLCWLRQLHKVAVGRASDLLKVHGEQLPLRALKAAGAEGNLEEVAEYSRTLTEQKEQLVEVGGIRGTGSRGASRRVMATWICGWKSVVMFAFIWFITFWCHSNHCAFLGKHALVLCYDLHVYWKTEINTHFHKIAHSKNQVLKRKKNVLRRSIIISAHCNTYYSLVLFFAPDEDRLDSNVI